MKIKRSIIWVWMLLSGCSTIGTVEKTDSQRRPYRLNDFLKVYKIDSINNYYLVYGRRKKSLFKIISKKDSSVNGNKIHLNGRYKFFLESIWNEKVEINGVAVWPPDIETNCLGFDSVTSICLERPWINDLYYPYNLKGLHLAKK